MKQRKRATIHIPIILIILMIAIFAVTHKVKIVVWGSVFLALHVFFIHRAYKTGMYKTVQRLYEEQDTKGFICEHILEINDVEIIEKTDVNERKEIKHQFYNPLDLEGHFNFI